MSMRWFSSGLKSAYVSAPLRTSIKTCHKILQRPAVSGNADIAASHHSPLMSAMAPQPDPCTVHGLTSSRHVLEPAWLHEKTPAHATVKNR